MIRIFIGASSMGEDEPIERAYAYTIKQNCSEEVQINWMRQDPDPKGFWHGFQTAHWSTPFSGFRWAIPEYCDFKGRAIYTDCDMLNYRDLSELINIDLHGKPIAARRGQRFGGHEFCVMVIDCEAMQQHTIPVFRQKSLDNYHHRMIHMFSGNADLVEDLDPRWNCLDGEGRNLDDIWQLHFTNMATQPWKPAWFTGNPQPHPRADLVEEFEKYRDLALQDDWTVQYSTDVQYGVIGR
jgi:lipopolysaccharide biosynthesis glycosyltransferase